MPVSRPLAAFHAVCVEWHIMVAPARKFFFRVRTAALCLKQLLGTRVCSVAQVDEHPSADTMHMLAAACGCSESRVLQWYESSRNGDSLGMISSPTVI